MTIEELELKHGAHDSPDDGLCVMEAVAYFAGEPHSDKPKCCCPTIAAFLRSWNDTLKDEERQMLKPYALKAIGTNKGKELSEKRAYMVADWFIRTYTPTWLELAKLNDRAATLRALPEIVDAKAAKASETALGEASKAAYAARAAARDATRAAAWDAAWDAAWAATGAAARAAAWDALEPTVKELQRSAIELLDRMCEA